MTKAKLLLMFLMLFYVSCDLSVLFKGTTTEPEKTDHKPQLQSLNATCQRVYATTLSYKTNKDLYINNFYNSHPNACSAASPGWGMSTASKLTISQFLTYSTAVGIGVFGNRDVGQYNSCNSYNSTIRAASDKFLESGSFKSTPFIIAIDCNFNNTFYYDPLTPEITNETATDYTFNGTFAEYRGAQSGYEQVASGTFCSTFTFRTWQEKSFSPKSFYSVSLITAKKSSDATFQNLILNEFICLGYDILNNDLVLKLVDYELVQFTGKVASFDLIATEDSNIKTSYTITIN